MIVGYDPRSSRIRTIPLLRDASGNVLHSPAITLLIDFNPAPSLDCAHHHWRRTCEREHRPNGRASCVPRGAQRPGWQYPGDGSPIPAILADTGPIGGAAAPQPSLPHGSPPGVWDGEKLYQAARLITESRNTITSPSTSMLARSMARCRNSCPTLPILTWAFSLEFSQAVFRLGHSMLTETFNVTSQLIRPILPRDPQISACWRPSSIQQLYAGDSAPSALSARADHYARQRGR